MLYVDIADNVGVDAYLMALQTEPSRRAGYAVGERQRRSSVKPRLRHAVEYAAVEQCCAQRRGVDLMNFVVRGFRPLDFAYHRRAVALNSRHAGPERLIPAITHASYKGSKFRVGVLAQAVENVRWNYYVVFQVQ